jgi:tetratricopeptide (TPR) repeat protein
VCPLYNILPLCVDGDGLETEAYQRLDWNSNSTVCLAPVAFSSTQLSSSSLRSRRLQSSSSLNRYTFEISLSSLLGKEFFNISRIDTTSFPPTIEPSPAPTIEQRARSGPSSTGLSQNDIYSIAFPLAVVCLICIIFLIYSTLQKRARFKQYTRKDEVTLEDSFYAALSAAREYRDAGDLSAAEEQYQLATAILEGNSAIFNLDISAVDQAAAYYELGEVCTSLGDPLNALPSFHRAHGLFKDRMMDFHPQSEQEIERKSPVATSSSAAAPLHHDQEHALRQQQTSFQKSLSNLFPSARQFFSSGNGDSDEIDSYSSSGYSSSYSASSEGEEEDQEGSSRGVVSPSAVRITDTLVLDDDGDEEKEEDDPDSSFKADSSSSSSGSSKDDFNFTSQFPLPSDSSDEDQNILKIGSLQYHWNLKQQKKHFQDSLHLIPTIDGALEDEINRSFSKML